MLSPFIPAGEILGSDCKIRTIVLADDPRLPSGEYTFVDTYCTDKGCDCRKTMIQVHHGGKVVSIVNFGWEQPKYYLRWLNCPSDTELANEMSGLSIDISSPDVVSPEGMLILVRHLMGEEWVSIIKEHYRRVRQVFKSANTIQFPTKISRNARCPCGSGKKYKNCCLPLDS